MFVLQCFVSIVRLLDFCFCLFFFSESINQPTKKNWTWHSSLYLYKNKTLTICKSIPGSIPGMFSAHSDLLRLLSQPSHRLLQSLYLLLLSSNQPVYSGFLECPLEFFCSQRVGSAWVVLKNQALMERWHSMDRNKIIHLCWTVWNCTMPGSGCLCSLYPFHVWLE